MKHKLVKVLALSAIGIFGLVACDEIVAKPNDYSSNLITVSGWNKEIYNNVMSVVYDQIHDGSGIGSDTLDKILYNYSVALIGRYDKTQLMYSETAVPLGEITLKDAYGDEAKAKQFAKNHPAYWDSTRTSSEAEASATEVQRVKAKFETIEKRIAKEMYNKISGTTYADRSIYYEALFLRSLRGELKKVADPAASTTKAYVGQILPSVEPEEVFTKQINGDYLLHKENYQSESNTYIVDEILPNIYKDLLNDQYVLDNTYNSLGRSYARKVNILKLKNVDNYPDVAFRMAKKIVGEIYDKNQFTASTDVLQRFKEYSEAYIGVFDYKDVEAEKSAAQKIVESLSDVFTKQNETGTIPYVGTYFLGTSYGDLAKEFAKLHDAKGKYDETAHSKFTSSNTYPEYIGLGIESRKLQEEDYTTTGWYIKNGGLSDLPEAIRSRLFNIGVANGVKETAEEQKLVERYYDSSSKLVVPDEENNYIVRVNGHNYLKTSSRISGTDKEYDILHYDSDSKTYYIVEVVEAVSSSKLSKTSDNRYEKTRGSETMESIINSVNNLVSEEESYSTLATKHYLEKMEIKYHDQSVYDYFVSNYPELFD